MSDKIVEVSGSAAPSRSVHGTLYDTTEDQSIPLNTNSCMTCAQVKCGVVPVLGPSDFFSKLSAMLLFNHGLSFPLEQPRLLNIIQ